MRGMRPEELTELFTTFQRSAWRLEARDDYAIPGEDQDFDDFLAGRPLAERTVENNWWMATVAAARAANKTFGRVRLITRPVSDYTRFELVSYPENVAAGEDVFVLDRAWLAPVDEHWAHQDFWLFDDDIAVLQHFSSTGKFLGVERASDPAPYCEIHRRAMSLAVPLDEYSLVQASVGVARAPTEARVSDP
jgi:hypothetical protein